MKHFFTIWRKEMGAYFLSPIAYVTMAVFLSTTSWLFLQLVTEHEGINEPLSSILFRILFLWIPLLISIITMRLFAEEKRSGTIETLMTAPVTDIEVVLGKYAGSFSFLLIITAPAIASIFLLKTFSPGINYLDIGALVGGVIIFVLLAAFCVSIGLLISLATQNQIISAICCFCATGFILFAGDLLAPFQAGSSKLIQYIYSGTHVLEFARGSIDTRPIVLYISGTIFTLFTAVRFLESRKWR